MPITTSGINATVTLSYNVLHTVTIVATNCNGSSSAVMETIPAIGEFYQNLLIMVVMWVLMYHNFFLQLTVVIPVSLGMVPLKHL